MLQKKNTRSTLTLGSALVFALAFIAFSLPAHAGQAADDGDRPAVQSRDESPAPYSIDDIIEQAKKGSPGTLGNYLGWRRQSGADSLASLLEQRSKDDIVILKSLDEFASMIESAESHAETALGNTDYSADHFRSLMTKALDSDDEDALALEALEAIVAAWRRGDDIVRRREELFGQYQDEALHGRISKGTRLAWSLIRVGASRPDTAVLSNSFRHDADGAEISLRYLGADIHLALTADDYQSQVRATVDGYRFRTGWAVLFQKPLGWMASMAKAMREAGVAENAHAEWIVMEAPEGLIALAPPEGDSPWDVPEAAFFRGAARQVSPLPPPPEAGRMKEIFFAAAKALHDGVMADESIPQPIRKALKPVLAGTYSAIDPRDYFDNEFCRRLIEADYLEAHIGPLVPERAAELAAYRDALAKLEAGLDLFAVDMGGGERLVAQTRPDMDLRSQEEADYSDNETGETLYRYLWRWEKQDETAFHSPLPSRYLYAMSVLERYDGRHASRPRGVPSATEVWHALQGKLAAYRVGDTRATGDSDAWLEAVVLDARGRRESNSGPLGWNFPLFVPVRDDQGDPVLLATLRGVVPSPDFSGLSDMSERRRAQDEWLDQAARVLPTPGELALIYQQFFRYCSDSPLPELPNLIGSHYGLSDTHQTVYQSLERRWVGRLIGDCDDLAEFFQNIADRQGKLCHVMQLPAHAAAGYLEEDPDGGYQFIVLQTGPVLRFTDATRDGAVEKAYRYFDDEEGGSQFTQAAVPLLLRFAEEDTRTPFVLSARIYWDRDYAEDMIQVQEYWHLHTYSAGVAAMERMLESDREVGSLKELASLYERVGLFDKSEAVRLEELAAVEGDPLAELSTLMDIAQLHVHANDKPKAMDALGRMEKVFRDLRDSSSPLYNRALWFRSSWAALLSRLGEPDRAWPLVRHDVEESMKYEGRFSDMVLRTLVAMYDRMSIQRDEDPERSLPRESAEIRLQVRAALAKAFGPGYFKADDSYNKIHSRYYWLGRYGVSAAGRKAGLESLWLDGPYPTTSREHDKREEDLTEADWEWFRVMPRLYLNFGLEMLDRDDYPELYDPVGARRCLELVQRAIDKGSAVGSNVMGEDSLVKSELILSFFNRDRETFDRKMTLVRGKDYSSLYDDAALAFGTHCGLLPLSQFSGWIEAFHRFFPGRQHYFKAAYHAMDKGHFDHAVMLARATAKFFPDDPLMAEEAASLVEAVERMRAKKLERGWDDRDWTRHRTPADESAAWRRDMVEFSVEAAP